VCNEDASVSFNLMVHSSCYEPGDRVLRSSSIEGASCTGSHSIYKKSLSEDSRIRAYMYCVAERRDRISDRELSIQVTANRSDYLGYRLFLMRSGDSEHGEKCAQTNKYRSK